MIKDTTEVFWGKPCKHGHVNEEGKTLRYARNSKSCITCNRIQASAWHKDPDNQERIKQYQENTKGRKTEWHKKWVEKNRDHYREYQRNYRREYVKRNPDKIREIEERHQIKKAAQNEQSTVE